MPCLTKRFRNCLHNTAFSPPLDARMLRRGLGLLLLLIGITGPMHAQGETNALWLRYSAISPDGKTIAFSAQGHLFRVPASGGIAEPITAGPQHDFMPVWSGDSEHLAYASNPYGNFDIYLISVKQGIPMRLTTHSADEFPSGFTPDGKEILFSAHRMDSKTNAQFPSARVMPELYKISINPGRAPEQVLTTPALAARWNRKGDRLVYEDLKGYENLWRKHHTSSVAHDIWIYDPKAGTHLKLTNFPGEDRDPVFARDQNSVYYLSESSGSFNVWKRPLEGDAAAPVQITSFSRNPVRFLSISDSGDLCFGFRGEIYTIPQGTTEPKKVEISLRIDTRPDRIETLLDSNGITEMALNPDAKEIAFVYRGEIFVASTRTGSPSGLPALPNRNEWCVSVRMDGALSSRANAEASGASTKQRSGNRMNLISITQRWSKHAGSPKAELKRFSRCIHRMAPKSHF
jgi:tricorn protease